MAWKPLIVLAGLAAVATGAWLLSASPEASSSYREWRPGEPFNITHETGDRTWRWSFTLPNDDDHAVQVKVGFLFNMSVVESEPADEWHVITRLIVDDEVVDGLDRGGNGCCISSIVRADHDWTLPARRESFVEATVENVGKPPERSRDWRVEYDPLLFEVTTTSRSLYWALAAPGTGLLLAGFATLAAVAVPWRLR